MGEIMSRRIGAKENGPLVLECAEEILHQDGRTVEKRNPAYLCRCGQSKNKPFCDGAHVAAGFSSEREISEEILQVYEGKRVTITFNRSVCAGAANCVRGLPTVFDSEGSEDWIHPDGDESAKIIEAINACPSWALSCSVGPQTTTDDRETPGISIVKNGPYNVEGVPLDHTPTPTHCSTTKYSLCRCGHSKNKPFCDYSHAEKNWSDS
jgi:CDGSH-type Zn-finger protein/ferredoxin